ncbi:MAG TPA: IS30 family transposase [bacterium]
MGAHYQHLSKEERDLITVYKAQGCSLREIGGKLGRDKATISRELQRNAPEIRKWYYLSHKAQERAQGRWGTAHIRARLKSPIIQAYVVQGLKAGLSPELIAGRLPLDHPDVRINHEAIYKYIYATHRELIRYLVRHNKKRRCRGHSRKHQQSHIPNRVAIAVRPAGVAQRERAGDWEADTVISRQSKAALQVLGDRASRLVRIRKIRQTTSAAVRQAISGMLGAYPVDLRHTITYDNGHENVEHEWINQKLGTMSFFCNPYHSWEKGTVENLIGLIRRYLPKRTDLSKMRKDRIMAIENRLNSRPRKCLAYRTPFEVSRQLSCVALTG